MSKYFLIFIKLLYIVSTPIWNLEDITLRALSTLKTVDLIACEDTRVTSKLLSHYWIKKSLLSFHSYSWITKLEKIIEELKNWKNVALVSDAGTPWISDPWYLLVKEALINGIEVTPIPWVTAFTTALMASWMQMNHFLYLWFLPLKKWRQTLFQTLKNRKEDSISETVVIYESVHRLLKTLKEIEKHFWSEYYIVVARELTKKFEEFNRWKISDIIQYFENNLSKQKGEFVILF